MGQDKIMQAGDEDHILRPHPAPLPSLAAPAPTNFARVFHIIFVSLGAEYTVDLAISTYRDYKDKRLFPLKNAPAKEKVARIHDIINKKGERAGFMTLGELAKDLKALGGIWNALAEVKVNK